MKALKRKSIQALALLLLTASLCYGQNTARQITIRGVGYAAQGKYKEAKGEFKEALKIDPYFTFAEESLNVLENVKEGKIKAEAATYFFKGIAHRLKRELNEAIAEFNKAISKDPMFALAYNNRGKVYRWKEQYDRALSDHNKAIKINPSYAMAYVSRGLTYAYKGQWFETIADCSKAIELNPSDAISYRYRGLAYASQGQYDLAISDYTKAIDIEPRLAKAYYGRGLAYSHKGQHDQAIADYSKAIERNPKYAKAYGYRGFAYLNLGIHHMACSDGKKACELGFCKIYKEMKKQGTCEDSSSQQSIAKVEKNTKSQTFYKSSSATQRIMLLEGAGELWFDPSKWRLIKKDLRRTMGEYNLQHSKERDVGATIGTQSIGLPFSLMKKASIRSIQKSDWHDAQIQFQEERLVNGNTVLSIRWDAKITKTKAKGYEFSTFEYNWSGRAGSIKIQASTNKSLYGLYEEDIIELLNGLIIKRPN